MKKGYIEHGKEVEILSKEENGWKVRIVGKDEVTEKIVAYEPISLTGWKYKEGTLVKKKNNFFYLKHYTTYLKEGKLVYAYTTIGINRFDDSMEYEYRIDSDYEVNPEAPYLTEEELEIEINKQTIEERPLYAELKEAKEKVAQLESSIKEVEKKYDIKSKCKHEWELDQENEINEGKTTEKIYYCDKCGSSDTHYWHSLSF